MSVTCGCLKRFIQLEKKRGKDAQHRFSNYSRDKRVLLKSNMIVDMISNKFLQDEQIIHIP